MMLASRLPLPCTPHFHPFSNSFQSALCNNSSYHVVFHRPGVPARGFACHCGAVVGLVFLPFLTVAEILT